MFLYLLYVVSVTNLEFNLIIKTVTLDRTSVATLVEYLSGCMFISQTL